MKQSVDIPITKIPYEQPKPLVIPEFGKFDDSIFYSTDNLTKLINLKLDELLEIDTKDRIVPFV
jgi:hypothetical protein